MKHPFLLLVQQIPEANAFEAMELVSGRHAKLPRTRDVEDILLLFLFIPRLAGGGMSKL